MGRLSPRHPHYPLDKLTVNKLTVLTWAMIALLGIGVVWIGSTGNTLFITNATIIDVNGSDLVDIANISAGNVSINNLTVRTLNDAFCDVKSSPSGNLYCGLDADSNATTACIDGSHEDGSGVCYDTNATIDARTIAVTYKADNIQLVTGTYETGDINSVNESKDGDEYNVSEVGGANPLTIRVNFSNVTDFNNIILRELYEGGAGHEIIIGLYDYVDGGYEEEYGDIDDMDNYAFSIVDVLDPANHISDGIVSLQFRHEQSGNPAHHFSLDYVTLIDGTSTIVTTEHDGLSGRDSPVNHPWVSNMNYTNLCLFNESIDFFGNDLYNINEGNFSKVNLDSLNNIYYVQAGNASDIQTKINSASGGDKVIIPPGFYTVSSAIVLNKNVAISGEGFGTILNFTGTGNISAFNVTDVSGISLSNFKLIVDGDANGILVYASNDITIENLFIEGNLKIPTAERRAINLRGTINSKVIENTITGKNWDTGIRIDNNFNGNITDLHNLIYGNILYDLGTEPDLSNSIATGTAIENEANLSTSTKYNIYSGNIVNNVRGHGIRVIECRYCTIENNIVSNTNRSGVWLKDTNYSLISNNVINFVATKGDSHAGIYLGVNNEYNSVVGNIVHNSKTQGINISALSNNNFISNNRLYENDLGNISDSGSNNAIFQTNSGNFGILGRLGVGTLEPSAEFEVEDLSGIALMKIDAGTDARLSFSEDGAPVSWTIGSDSAGGVSADSFFIQNGPGPTATNELEINQNGDITLRGNLSIGRGSSQVNITMTSPDATEWACGVNDLGFFDCGFGITSSMDYTNLALTNQTNIFTENQNISANLTIGDGSGGCKRFWNGSCELTECSGQIMLQLCP